jgi:hypothetical protein
MPLCREGNRHCSECLKNAVNILTQTQATRSRANTQLCWHDYMQLSQGKFFLPLLLTASTQLLQEPKRFMTNIPFENARITKLRSAF